MTALMKLACTQYPDVVSLVEDIFGNSADLQSFIVDAEIVAVDASDGSLRTFQELSNRARRDVKLDDVTVSVCVFAFDLMYYNNEVSMYRTTSVPDGNAEGYIARSCWRSHSAFVELSCGRISHRIRRRKRSRLGLITFRVAKAKPAKRLWKSSGRQL